MTERTRADRLEIMDRTSYDPATSSGARPRLSLVVVVYDMPDQARRTLHSLSPGYQRNASPEDYEVIVVENASGRLLGEGAATGSGPNVRYFLREEPSASPVSAVNFGANHARGETVGILVDGARLLSPGVVELALLAGRAGPSSVLSVPGYHLGTELQQKAVESGYDEAAEAGLLSGIGWPEDGYRLFEIACLSGSCAGGFFGPFAESNCLCLSKSLFEKLGGFDPAFTSTGGGFCNLDFYARVLEVPDITLFVTPGEGTFHQFHGGATTGGIRVEERARFMAELRAEYLRLRGEDFELIERDAMYLGRIHPSARTFFRQSMQRWGDDAASVQSAERGAP